MRVYDFVRFRVDTARRVLLRDLVLVSKFWKPGRSRESRRKDQQAQAVLQELFPEREIVAIHSENINRGGGGMNCITQQQPASATFASALPKRD